MLSEGIPVKIRIYSTTKDEDGYQPTVMHSYRGIMQEKNGKYYAVYTDSSESGFAGTRTTIKWDDERVLILRSGSLKHRQEFFTGMTDASVYKTPYLEIPMTTTTYYLNTYFRRGIWHLDVDYKLEHSGAVYGDIKLLVEIEEVEQ